MKRLPRLLVVSNNCFSRTNSNGRILSELLMDYSKSDLAQFFIKKDDPDFSVCENYYLVTDTEVLNSIKGKPCGRVLSDQDNTGDKKPDINPSGHTKSKGVCARIARNWVWKFGRWNNEGLKKWIDSFDPECVLLQSGDSVFMLKFAYSISIERGIPLIIFNSEDYYFKKLNYLGGGLISDFVYKFYIANYRRHFDKIINRATHSVYICGSLKELYDEKYRRPSSVIMSSTDIIADLPLRDRLNQPPRFSYLGNLGLKRHEALIEVAEALNSINNNFRLDVYGKTSNSESIDALNGCRAINYHGFVSYDEVKTVMKSSDFLFHAECFDENIIRDIRNGFSTKIADSLACGVCFVFYGDKSIEGAKYLKSNDCACVITDKSMLRYELEHIINDGELRLRYISNALKVVEKNHRADKNRQKMESIICESITDQLCF